MPCVTKVKEVKELRHQPAAGEKKFQFFYFFHLRGNKQKVKKEKSCERCFEKGKNRSAKNCVVLRKTNSEKVYNLE